MKKNNEDGAYHATCPAQDGIISAYWFIDCNKTTCAGVWKELGAVWTFRFHL
jgi:hypothetical protein